VENGGIPPVRSRIPSTKRVPEHRILRKLSKGSRSPDRMRKENCNGETTGTTLVICFCFSLGQFLITACGKTLPPGKRTAMCFVATNINLPYWQEAAGRVFRTRPKHSA